MKINRALSIVLVALMLVAMLPTFAFAAGTGTVTISGNSEFVSAPVGEYSKLTYVATYNSGEEGATDVTDPTAFSWEVTEDGVAATDVWCVDGEFIVKGGATGTYNITATHKETGLKSADFSVTVTASTVRNGDDGAGEDTDGNKYYNTNLNISTDDYHLSSGQPDAGFKTLNFRFKISSDGFSSGKKRILCDTTGWKDPIGARNNVEGTPSDKFALASEAGVFSPVCDLSGNIKFLDYDTWYELSVVFDVPSDITVIPRITDLWLEGEHCKTWNVGNKIVNDSVALNDGVIENLRFYPNSDDIVMYSGAPYFPAPVIKETGEIYIPQASGVKNYVQLSASSIIYGSDGITWSIPETPGVSIDANTGLVTVTNEAVAGTVKVTATQQGFTGTADLVLKVISEDFEAGGNNGVPGSNTKLPWFYSVVASEDNGNQYAEYGNDTGNHGFIGNYPIDARNPESQKIDESSITADGSMVMEFKFKRSGGANTRFIFDNIHTKSINLGSSEDWATAKLVYSTPKNLGDTYILNAIVDGELIYHNYVCDENVGLYRIQFQTEAIDDFKLYGADFAVPEVYDVTLPDTAPGSELALTYKYFNEGSVAENGTEIVWSYADSENSENWTDLTAFDNKTAIDAETTATLKGKYVKAVVTPKTVNPYTNEVVAGASAEAVALIDDVVLSTECTVDGNSFNIDSDSLAAGKTLSYTISATQIQEDAETYMVVAATYTADGKELLAADAKDLTTEKGDAKSVTVSATKAEDSMIKVFVFKKADISPVIYNPVK